MIETTKAIVHGAPMPAVGWSSRPATGRSFFTMMVLVVVATGLALFLALRPSTERGHRESRAGPGCAPKSGMLTVDL